MSAAAADRSRVRLEERAVEIQALAQDAGATTDRLLTYDGRENERHLALQTADERTEQVLERQLVAGDVWEATQLERLRDRATALATEGHQLAGDITRLLEVRGHPELLPAERAS